MFVQVFSGTKGSGVISSGRKIFNKFGFTCAELLWHIVAQALAPSFL